MSGNIKLLLVDDEQRFLETLRQRLELRNFEVTPVTNGQAALDAAKEGDFDLALLDLRMPGLGGEEVLRVLREKHPLIEVVILTGHGSVDSAVHCTKLGSYGYLQKPCETDELLEVLRAAYQRRVQRKLDIDDKRMMELLSVATGESPLGILRRLRELEKGE